RRAEGGERAEVAVVQVIPRGYETADLPFDRNVIEPALHQEVEKALERAGGVPDVDLREVLRWGDSPADEIVGMAGEERADLVVLGTHGRGAVTRALIGSVASGVARAAPCPVLLVPPALWAGGGGE